MAIPVVWAAFYAPILVYPAIFLDIIGYQIAKHYKVV